MPYPSVHRPEWNGSCQMDRSYNPLRDSNLAAHLGSKNVRHNLIMRGLIAPDGRILDRDAAARVSIVEQEIDNAERQQQGRLDRIEFHKKRMSRRAAEMQSRFSKHCQTQQRREQEVEAMVRRKLTKEQLWRQRGLPEDYGSVRRSRPVTQHLRPDSASRIPLWSIRPPLGHVSAQRDRPLPPAITPQPSDVVSLHSTLHLSQSV